MEQGLCFKGKFERYQDLIRQKRNKGDVALCYIKSRSGYCMYIYDGRCWVFVAPPKMPTTLAEEGKCIVIDKIRVTGKGWALVVDDKPKGLEIGGKISNNRGIQYTVEGFGGLSNLKAIELLLSPNSLVGVDISKGDVLTVVTK